MARKVNVSIDVEGQAISPISNLTIAQKSDWHHTFQVSCPINEKNNSLLTESKNYIGKTLNIEVGSDWFGGAAKGIFKGVVIKVALSRNQGSGSMLVISGYSPTLLMDEGPNCVSFTEKKLKDIVSEVTGKYGDIDTKNAPVFKGKIPYAVQYKESNYQYLSRMAAAYGEWFFYDGLSLYFGKPAAEDPISLKLGKELTEFEIGLRLMPTEFKLQAYDYLNNKVHESPSDKATVSDLDQYGSLVLDQSKKLFNQKPLLPVETLVTSKSDLDDFATRKRKNQASSMVVVTGASDNPFLKIGSTVKILGTISIPGSGGIGTETDYGEFTITNITHFSDGSGNYQNQFEGVPASLKHPVGNPNVKTPYCEDQIAVVEENNDPEGLGRIQVKHKWQEGSETTPWIRLATTAGGAGQGFFIVPEKGDEVMIGFVHRNPDKPYVIGSVYHGKSKPEGGKDSDNNKKFIKTKSGNQIFFNDEGGKEEIKIENGTNVITLTLESPGQITIATAGDMKLTGKNITISAENDLTLSAGKALTESGDEVTISGTKKVGVSSMETTISGTTKTVVGSDAQLELSGGAMASLQAPMVKLN